MMMMIEQEGSSATICLRIARRVLRSKCCGNPTPPTTFDGDGDGGGGGKDLDHYYCYDGVGKGMGMGFGRGFGWGGGDACPMVVRFRSRWNDAAMVHVNSPA